MSKLKARHQAKRKPGRGRPTKFNREMLEQAKKLAAIGLYDYEIAEHLKINKFTFLEWKAKHAEFNQAVVAGREAANQRVERSLYKRAVGYSHKAVKIFKPKGETPTRVYYTEHYPPDPQACLTWLKNRDPENWKDRVEVDHRHVFNFIGMLPSEEEWNAQYASHKEPLIIAAPAHLIEDGNDESQDIEEVAEAKGNGKG